VHKNRRGEMACRHRSVMGRFMERVYFQPAPRAFVCNEGGLKREDNDHRIVCRRSHRRRTGRARTERPRPSTWPAA
jgi:hypothetical protein